MFENKPEEGVVTASIPESPWLEPFEAISFSFDFLFVLFFFLNKINIKHNFK